MELHLTAVFRAVPEGYIGFVEELPGANTQGVTLEEARANLREAVELVLEANHSIYVNRATRKTSAVPRHTEINEDLAKKSAEIWVFRVRNLTSCRSQPGAPTEDLPWTTGVGVPDEEHQCEREHDESAKT